MSVLERAAQLTSRLADRIEEALVADPPPTRVDANPSSYDPEGADR